MSHVGYAVVHVALYAGCEIVAFAIPIHTFPFVCEPSAVSSVEGSALSGEPLPSQKCVAAISTGPAFECLLSGLLNIC